MAILKEGKNGLVPSQQLNLLSIEPQDDFTTKITQAYDIDMLAQSWIKDGRKQPLMYNDKLYVPAALIEELVKMHYDNPKYGHPGVTRIMGLIGRY